MISNDKQLDLSLLGEVRQIIDLPYDEIARCTTPLSAVRHCMGKIDISEEMWAECLGVTQGALNNIINADHIQQKRTRNFPLHWINLIQRKAGNRCISQYLDLESKGQLRCQQKQEQELTVEEKAKLYDEQMRAG